MQSICRCARYKMENSNGNLMDSCSIELVSYMRLNRRTKNCARISIRTSFLEYSVCCKPNRQNQH